MKPFLGILTGVVVIIGTIPYLRDVLRKETKPSRSTWALLTILLFIDVFIQGQLGSGWARAFTVGDLIATGSVFVLSLKYGVGGFERSDKICYVLWLIMVACWLGLNRPLLALHFGILADFISMIPTLIKSWRKPHEESINIFAASALSGFIAIFAAEQYTYRATLLPLYLFLINLVTVTILVIANRRLQGRRLQTTN